VYVASLTDSGASEAERESSVNLGGLEQAEVGIAEPVVFVWRVRQIGSA